MNATTLAATMKPSVATIPRSLVRSYRPRCLLLARPNNRFHTSRQLFRDNKTPTTKLASTTESTSKSPTVATKSTQKTSIPSSEQIETARAQYDDALDAKDKAVEAFAATCQINEDKTVEVLDATAHAAAKVQVEAAYDRLIPATVKLNDLLGNSPLADPSDAGTSAATTPQPSSDSTLTPQLEAQQPSSSSTPSSASKSVSSSKLSPHALVTNHIATASSTPLANRATILAAQAHLARRNAVTFGFDPLLAQSLRAGKLVRFADADERRRAVALAQEQSDAAARRMSVQKRKDVRPREVGFQSAPGKYRQEVVDRVAKGAYGVPLRQEEKEERTASLVAQIGRRLVFNETFTQKPGVGFVETIKRLLPQASKQ